MFSNRMCLQKPVEEFGSEQHIGEVWEDRLAGVLSCVWQPKLMWSGLSGRLVDDCLTTKSSCQVEKTSPQKKSKREN